MTPGFNRLWSISTSLVLPIVLMGLLAMALVMVTTDIYREHTIKNQRQAISELVKVEARELLGKNLELSNELALSLNAAHFKNALRDKDAPAAQNYLDSSFNRYFVTAGIIKLEKLYAYDRDFTLITSSTRGVTLKQDQPAICPGLLDRARIRTGAERLASIHELCTYEGQPYLSVIVPVGGLRSIGYLQAVTDPRHFHNQAETRIGAALRMKLMDGEIVYQSRHWPETSLDNHIVSHTVINNDLGIPTFTVETSRNESAHYEELKKIRNRVMLITGLLTLVMGALALLFIRASTIKPVLRLMRHSQAINKESIQLNSQIDISGTKEISALASSFNAMTHRLSELYQDLTSSNKSLADEVTERKAIAKELQQAHDALAEKVSELNAQTNNLTQTNEQLMLAKEEAENANREKSKFLTRMSHELRTPLNSIIGFSQLMTVRKDDAEQDQTEWAKHIYDSGRYLLSLVDEILDLASIEAGKIQLNIEPVEVMPLLRDCMQITSPSAEHRDINTFLDLIPCSENLIINADALRLKQVFLNLLSNAVKYNSEGGELKLGCDMPENNRIRITFSDSGEGIDTESQKQLFIPFSRLNADKKCIPGTGVGLAVTRQLTELMNGKIGVDSEPGKGSTFWVEFDCEISA